MPGSEHILIVDDSPTQLRQLQLVLEGDGFSTKTAENGKQALAEIESDPPAVVVTDLQMPEMDGLELVAAVKQRASNIPVILTTSQGSEEIAAKALRAGAASYVPKRFMATDLAATVRQVMEVSRAAHSSMAVAQFAVESSIALCVDNDETLVPSLISRLELTLVELNLFDEGERMQIAMALDEALVNAMIHGNLEVSSELRHLEDGKPYLNMIKQRKQTAPYRDRRVHVRLVATGTEATFVVRDDGDGFDRSILPDPTEPENLEKAGGRGLLLINAFMDEVGHNEKGNEITMVKRKPVVDAS